MGTFSTIVLFAAFLQLSFAGNIPATNCPEAGPILPASCYIDSILQKVNLGFHVSYGAHMDVENKFIEKLFQVTRDANGLAPNETLDIWEMVFRRPTIKQIDLSPMKNTRLYILSLHEMIDFEEIIGGPEDDPSTEQDERMELEYLYVYNNYNLNDTGLRPILKYLSPPIIETMRFGLCNLSTFPNPEDLAILQTFPELFNIDLGSNNYRVVRSKQFEGLHRLSYITLDYQYIHTIEENGFYLGEPQQECLPNSTLSAYGRAVRCKWIRISLQGNQLNDDSIHPNHGLASVTWRPVELNLYNNTLTNLREDIWRDFLYAHPENLLRVTSNPIVCGPGTQWLQDNWAYLESRVWGANCINAINETVFTYNNNKASSENHHLGRMIEKRASKQNMVKYNIYKQIQM